MINDAAPTAHAFLQVPGSGSVQVCRLLGKLTPTFQYLLLLLRTGIATPTVQTGTPSGRAEPGAARLARGREEASPSQSHTHQAGFPLPLLGLFPRGFP